MPAVARTSFWQGTAQLDSSDKFDLEEGTMTEVDVAGCNTKKHCQGEMLDDDGTIRY